MSGGGMVKSSPHNRRVFWSYAYVLIMIWPYGYVLVMIWPYGYVLIMILSEIGMRRVLKDTQPCAQPRAHGIQAFAQSHAMPRPCV